VDNSLSARHCNSCCV